MSDLIGWGYNYGIRKIHYYDESGASVCGIHKLRKYTKEALIKFGDVRCCKVCVNVLDTYQDMANYNRGDRFGINSKGFGP